MTTAVIPPPLFVKANFHFSLGGRDYSFLNQGVSTFGISGLRWQHFDPFEKVGMEVKVTVDVLAKERFRIITQGALTAEQTTDSSYLGIRFYLNDSDRVRLAKTISEEGFFPTQYLRKYPRVPALESISSMPLRAIAEDNDGELIVFDIANISPTGMLLYSDNPRAGFYLPGSRIAARLEPRGTVLDTCTFDGLVCRTVQERRRNSKDVSTYLGVRITRMSPKDKEAFLEIFRIVLRNIMNEGLVSEE